MTARGGSFSNVTGSTGIGGAFVVFNSPSTTDGVNEDFVSNANGELEYVGAGTKDFEGVVFITGDKNGSGIPVWTLTGGLDTGSGYAPIDVQRSSQNAIGPQHRCMSVRYRVTLSTGDKVRPMLKCSASITWRNSGMGHVILESTGLSRGVAYQDPVAFYNTVTIAGDWKEMSLVSFTDAENIDFIHHSNGELEYTGVATKTFEGYMNCNGRKNSGAGVTNYYLTAGISTDAGVSYAPIDSGRFNLMETGQADNEGIWINYTVTLNTGDRVRPMMFCPAVRTFENYSFDHLIMERNQ